MQKVSNQPWVLKHSLNTRFTYYPDKCPRLDDINLQSAVSFLTKHLEPRHLLK